MEQNFNTVKPITTGKAGLNFGLFFGAIMILEFIIAYALDIQPQANPWVGIVNSILNNLVLPILFIALACNAFKKGNGGYIKFNQALKTGVATSVIGAAFFALFNIIFNLIFPEFQEEMMNKMREAMAMQNPNMTSDQLEMALTMTETFMKPYIAFPFTIMFYAFIGLIYSLIVGAIVKKENPYEHTPGQVNEIGSEQ